MLLYAITNRRLLAEAEPERVERLAALAASWAANGVDFIQIREKDLAPTALTHLAAKIVQAVRQAGSLSKVLVNGEPGAAAEIALASGADGIHIPGGLHSDPLPAALGRVRQAWQPTRTPAMPPVISASCHSVEEVRAARSAGASLALFAPVFEKALPNAQALAGKGLDSLAQACRAGSQPGPHPALPVIALGGVTVDNAGECVEAGADGIAGIRLFLGNRWARAELDAIE